MKNKLFIIGFIMCFWGSFASRLSAQEYKNFDIRKYYTPDIVRNQLDLSFNSQGSFSSDKRTTDSTFNNGFSTTINPELYRYVNTRKLYTYFNLSAQLNAATSNSGLFKSSSTNSMFSSDSYLQLNWFSNWYNSKNQFITVGLSGHVITKINPNQATTVGNIYNYYNYSIQPRISIGSGRIESVEDARQALYILDELSKKGVLTRQLNNDEIFKLSQEISRVKNKRFFDSRLHLIDEISSIDSFMVSNKLLNKQDAPYFTTLYDLWQYGALFQRGSGQRFMITFSPNVEFDNFEMKDSIQNYDRSMYRELNLNTSYYFTKPIGLDWQHTLSATLTGILSERTDNTKGNYVASSTPGTANGFKLNGNYGINYYPNTRTNFGAWFNQNFSLLYVKDNTNPSNTSNSGFVSNTNLQFSADYYFSPQLKAVANIYFGYNLQRYLPMNFDQFYSSFSASLKYSIY